MNNFAGANLGLYKTMTCINIRTSSYSVKEKEGAEERGNCVHAVLYKRLCKVVSAIRYTQSMYVLY